MWVVQIECNYLYLCAEKLWQMERTLSFTGHRPEKIKGYTSHPQEVEARVREALAEAVKMFYRHGYRRFMTGMADGVDLWAADEIIRLREEGVMSEAEIVAVVPFRGHHRTTNTPALYQRVSDAATERVFICEEYHHNCYTLRNDYLVDNASALIAYCEGTPGGTKYTLQRARRQGLTIFDIVNPGMF